MHADPPNLRPNPAQEAFDKNEAQYALYRARKLAEREASEHLRPDSKSGTGRQHS